VADLAAFVEPLVAPGRVTSLAQTLLKLASPGVPDLYQGTELWDLSLVDPDNRRPVDYDARRRLLEKVRTASAEEIRGWDDEGGPKLWLLHRALDVRRRLSGCFAPASGYRPLTATGPRAANVASFVRTDPASDGQVAVVVPRLVLGLGDGWGDTAVELPPGRWADSLGGKEVDGGSAPLDELLSGFPVALLVRT
jgi:(1->4)-alpha-D-glucan 1-alpha-D-glucosylmutase